MKWLYLIVLTSLTGSPLFAQLTYETLMVDYDSAIEYKNLKIIPIRHKSKAADLPGIISFSKAIQTGMITLSERGTASTENVHWLRIKNKSTKPVFISSGEVVLGGRQDRMVTKDTLLFPNGSDQYIPVMCVEEGRWSDKEKKFTYNNYANLRLRKVLDQTRNQVRIWREIMKQLDSSKINSPTLAYAAKNLDKKHSIQKEEYFSFFTHKFKNTDSSVVGIVCISGDSIIGTDIFAGPNLFYNELDALLYGYIDEAITLGHPTVSDEEVRKYLDKFLIDEKSQEEYLKKNGKLYRYKGRVIHLTAY